MGIRQWVSKKIDNIHHLEKKALIGSLGTAGALWLYHAIPGTPKFTVSEVSDIVTPIYNWMGPIATYTTAGVLSAGSAVALGNRISGFARRFASKDLDEGKNIAGKLTHDFRTEGIKKGALCGGLFGATVLGTVLFRHFVESPDTRYIASTANHAISTGLGFLPIAAGAAAGYALTGKRVAESVPKYLKEKLGYQLATVRGLHKQEGDGSWRYTLDLENGSGRWPSSSNGVRPGYTLAFRNRDEFMSGRFVPINAL